MSNSTYAIPARKALLAGDRARFLAIRHGEAVRELNRLRVPHMVPTGELAQCPLTGREVPVRTNANLEPRNNACRRANRLLRAKTRIEGRLVKVIDRCDGFYEVVRLDGQKLVGLPMNGRYATRSSARDDAWLHGWSVEEVAA